MGCFCRKECSSFMLVAFSSSLSILCVPAARLSCLEVDCLGELIELKAGGFFHQDKVFASVQCTAAEQCLVKREKCWRKVLLTILV